MKNKTVALEKMNKIGIYHLTIPSQFDEHLKRCQEQKKKFTD
jgi:hypothetical protein